MTRALRGSAVIACDLRLATCGKAARFQAIQAIHLGWNLKQKRMRLQQGLQRQPS